jgi:plasmid maintenance system antidote protein VapI
LSALATLRGADTALRLGRLFGISPAFWMNIQARYDLEIAEDAAAAALASIKPFHYEAA